MMAAAIATIATVEAATTTRAILTLGRPQPLRLPEGVSRPRRPSSGRAGQKEGRRRSFSRRTCAAVARLVVQRVAGVPPGQDGRLRERSTMTPN
jgi:hypothetical protein